VLFVEIKDLIYCDYSVTAVLSNRCTQNILKTHILALNFFEIPWISRGTE